MIAKMRVAAFIAAVLLAGCDHQAATSQTSADPVPRGDGEFTGIPVQPLDSTLKTPPRAALVSLPAAYPPPPTPEMIAATTRPPTAPPPAVQDPTRAETTAPAAATPESTPSSMPPTAIATAADSTEPMAPPSFPVTAADTTSIPPPSTNSAANPSTPSIPNQNQLVVIDTASGRMVIALDDFAAPKTSKNFRQLIQDGFYNNTVFHRVIPNFIIQGGDPQSKSSATDRNTYGLGGPGYTIPPEIELKHDRGSVAMARLPDSVNPGRDSNGSQFYICLAACPSLDDQYTVFGHVIQGMEVADKLAEAPRDKRDNPLARIEMTIRLQSKDQIAGSAPNR